MIIYHISYMLFGIPRGIVRPQEHSGYVRLSFNDMRYHVLSIRLIVLEYMAKKVIRTVLTPPVGGKTRSIGQ